MVKNLTLSIAFIFLNLLSLLSFSQSNSVPKLQKDEFEFKILYNNDSSETAISEMYDDENTGKPFLFSDCKRIYPEDTKGLVVKNSDGQTFNAITFGGVWYFENTVGDKLSTYRTRPDLFNKGQFKSIYFRSSKNPSEFIPYNRTNAYKMVMDNPESLKIMKRHFTGKDFQKVSFISGGTLLVGAGLFLPLAGFGLIPGLGCSLVGFLINKPIKNDFYRSIEIYNETKQ